MKKKQIEMLKKFWNDRNPQHECNADSGDDMFWGTVLAIFNDMNKANDTKSEESNCNIPDVSNNEAFSEVAVCDDCGVNLKNKVYHKICDKCYRFITD